MNKNVRGDYMSRDKIGEELSSLRQELKDWKESTWGILKEIRTQTKATNGAVAKNLREIALLEEKYNTCPSRLSYPSAEETRENAYQRKTLYFTVLLNVILIIMNLYLVFIGGG